MAKTSEPGVAVEVASKIRVLGGQRVLLDSDLAALYGVQTHRLNESVAAVNIVSTHRSPLRSMAQVRQR